MIKIIEDRETRYSWDNQNQDWNVSTSGMPTKFGEIDFNNMTNESPNKYLPNDYVWCVGDYSDGWKRIKNHAGSFPESDVLDLIQEMADLDNDEISFELIRLTKYERDKDFKMPPYGGLVSVSNHPVFSYKDYSNDELDRLYSEIYGIKDKYKSNHGNTRVSYVGGVDLFVGKSKSNDNQYVIYVQPYTRTYD